MFGAVDGLFILAIILFIAGFVLIGVEMIIPGFSVPGVVGTICLLVGIFISSDSLKEGAIITIILLVLLGIMLAIILSLFTKGKLRSPIILDEEQKKDKGYISSSDLNYLLGKQGIASTDLRPAGTVNIDGIEFDVISESRYIPQDTKVVIYRVQGSKLIVKQKD